MAERNNALAAVGVFCHSTDNVSSFWTIYHFTRQNPSTPRGGVNRLTKSDLVERVAEKSGLTKKDAGRAVDAFIETVTEALGEGQRVQIVGFGTFEVRERAARRGRNPQTGQEIEIAARKVPAFKAGKALKDSVAN